MRDSERYRLLHGPYRAPRCAPGWRLTCQIRGKVVVGGMHDGRIPWPYARTMGRHPLIVCGDLARAIQQESEIAVAHWWGVDVATVSRWRRALGVPKANEGSSRLYRDWSAEILDEVARTHSIESHRTRAYRRWARHHFQEHPSPRPGRKRVQIELPADVAARYAAGEIGSQGVADLLGVGIFLAQRLLREAGLLRGRNGRPGVSAEETERERVARRVEIERLRAEGKTLKEIAVRFGVTYQAIQSALRSNSRDDGEL